MIPESLVQRISSVNLPHLRSINILVANDGWGSLKPEHLASLLSGVRALSCLSN